VGHSEATYTLNKTIHPERGKQRNIEKKKEKKEIKRGRERMKVTLRVAVAIFWLFSGGSRVAARINNPTTYRNTATI